MALTHDQKVYYSKTVDEYENIVDQVTRSNAQTVYFEGVRQRDFVQSVGPWDDRERGWYTYIYTSQMIIDKYNELLQKVMSKYGPFSVATPAKPAPLPMPTPSTMDKVLDTVAPVVPTVLTKSDAPYVDPKPTGPVTDFGREFYSNLKVQPNSKFVPVAEPTFEQKMEARLGKNWKLILGGGALVAGIVLVQVWRRLK